MGGGELRGQTRIPHPRNSCLGRAGEGRARAAGAAEQNVRMRRTSRPNVRKIKIDRDVNEYFK